MNIPSIYIQQFIHKSIYSSYGSICETLLTGKVSYSLVSQPGYNESNYLPENIRSCVKAYTSSKDTMIQMYRDFISFLKNKGIDVNIEFPPVPVSNTFERLMFVSKYLQDANHRIGDLEDILWVSSRTIEDDLRRLRGLEDPIQICGKKFIIPDTERKNGRMKFASTAHPIFLTENLTQVIVMLKGLKAMSEDSLYRSYVHETASDIWNQLSDYAKKRIHFVLSELIPDDLTWYESLEADRTGDSFFTERACSQVDFKGSSVILDCLKNGKSFCVEYEAENTVVLYKDCWINPRKLYRNPNRVTVDCGGESITLILNRVIRSAYTPEELAAN